MNKKKSTNKIKSTSNKDSVLKEEFKLQYKDINNLFKDILPIIETRRSIRKFKDLPVDWSDIVKILNAGRYAPSTGNLQTVRFIVITKQKDKETLAEGCFEQYWMINAPTVIIVCNEDKMIEAFYGKQNKEKYAIQNAAAAIENMLLEAHSLGLSSCWIGGLEEEKIRRDFDIPNDVSIHGILPIGYGDEEPETPKRYNLDYFVYLNKYGVKTKNKELLTGDYGDYIHEEIEEIILNTKKKTKKLSEKIKILKKKITKKNQKSS